MQVYTVLPPSFSLQGVKESNFRYTAARMCNCLSERMHCASGITFQSYLVNRFEAA